MRDWLLLVLAAVCLVVPPSFAMTPAGPSSMSSDADWIRRLTTDQESEKLEALAASISRREEELARRRREDILAQVEKRAREMKVTASVEQMTDLLTRKARLELSIDKCLLRAAVDCAPLTAELNAVEERFFNLAGVTAKEFKRGIIRDGAAAKSSERFITAENWDPNHCTCSFNVYSSNRWMNRYWGLECANHSGHGVCSSDVDMMHTPGVGAMVGSIYVFFGGLFEAECPDDQRTCFKGPPTNGHPGSWGNACSCDTWHSQFHTPHDVWFGGDLQDNEEVFQTWTGESVLDGSCTGLSVQIQESIQENDPVCCDDPMGTLIVNLPIQEGISSASAPASVQNCNAGSQSGVPPFCGTFGATIRVLANCRTEPDAVATCVGQCQSDPPGASCSCTAGCVGAGTCCPDYIEACCDTNPNWTACRN